MRSDAFKVLERFSNRFLDSNRKALRAYADRWVQDPLHQWSRQWEYPFVLGKIRPVIERVPRARILDAGSGITFFPHFLSSEYESATIWCCDNDGSLASIFRQVEGARGKRVQFCVSELSSLPCASSWFDVVYCISVLEHTHNFDQIIHEFFRILQPGGVLVITFDVSMDGTRDIAVERGMLLLSSLASHFEKDASVSLDLRSAVSQPGVFTTLSATRADPALLPWKRPGLLRQYLELVRTGHFPSWPPPLSVFCLALTKPGSASQAVG